MKIPKPEITINEVFDSCLSNMRKTNQEKYRPCFPDILSATKNYEKNMENGTPENVSKCYSICNVSKDDLEKLYTTKLSKASQPARKYYNKIIASAPRGICPYCKHQIVSTLDHYYPKSHYAALVITPTNLVPSCANCNKNKSDLVIRQKEDAVLNPYYEDSDSVIWLKATLNKDIASDFLTMSFGVHPSDDCGPSFYTRLERQFKILRLNDLYSKHAAEELIAVANRHLRIYKSAGTHGVKESISESLQENSYRPNSWQSAMYRGLDDNWYFNHWLPRYAEK